MVHICISVRGLCMYGVTNCCQMLAQLNFDNISWYITEAHFDSRGITQIKEEADETPNDDTRVRCLSFG